MKRATPATMSNTHRYLAIGYFFFKRVTPRSMTTGKKQWKIRVPTGIDEPNTVLLGDSWEKTMSEKEGLQKLRGRREAGTWVEEIEQWGEQRIEGRDKAQNKGERFKKEQGKGGGSR